MAHAVVDERAVVEAKVFIAQAVVEDKTDEAYANVGCVAIDHAVVDDMTLEAYANVGNEVEA
jgi:hypothetical protein